MSSSCSSVTRLTYRTSGASIAHVHYDHEFTRQYSDRQVTLEEANAKATQLNIMFMETSAKAGHNVKSLFKKIAMSLVGMEKENEQSEAQNTSTFFARVYIPTVSERRFRDRCDITTAERRTRCFTMSMLRSSRRDSAYHPPFCSSYPCMYFLPMCIPFHIVYYSPQCCTSLSNKVLALQQHLFATDAIRPCNVHYTSAQATASQLSSINPGSLCYLRLLGSRR